MNDKNEKIRLILFGPPGVGKGTQAKILSAKLNIFHVSTGDMLRNEVATDTEFGRTIRKILESGQLVPDDLMIEIIKKVIQSPQAENGFILDGFPRTLPQAEALTRLLVSLEMRLKMVISMEIKAEIVVERLSNRRVCRQCGMIYNILTDKVNDTMKCEKCGGELFQRDDDKPDIVRKRLNVYENMTAPVKFYYAKAGILRTIDAAGSIQSVTDKILGMLNIK